MKSCPGLAPGVFCGACVAASAHQPRRQIAELKTIPKLLFSRQKTGPDMHVNDRGIDVSTQSVRLRAEVHQPRIAYFPSYRVGLMAVAHGAWVYHVV
jgi:hypothetical protein